MLTPKSGAALFPTKQTLAQVRGNWEETVQLEVAAAKKKKAANHRIKFCDITSCQADSQQGNPKRQARPVGSCGSSKGLPAKVTVGGGRRECK